MNFFSAFITADGLDLDGERIYGKGSLQEVETGAVIPVGRFHAEKERSHTLTSRQVQIKQTRSPRYNLVCQERQRSNFSTASASEK